MPTIDVENVVRRLRENRELAPPRPALEVVLDASLEVRSAIVYASAIVLLVFVPIYFLPGLAGAFFRPLAIAYVLAVGASMLVALTLTPALALLLLGRASKPRACATDRRAAALGLLADASSLACSAQPRGDRCRRSARGYRQRRAAARRRFPAGFSGIRLPDALGREAGDLVARCSGSRA